MKCMNGNKYDIIILVHKLHNLMHPSLVILHADKSSEYADSIIYMDYIIPYRKGCQVVQGKLLALFHRSSYADTVETVEYLVVAVAAYLIFMVYESVMDIESGDEFRQYVSVLRKNGSESVKLRLLLTIDPYPVTLLKMFSDVLCKKFEILVEHRLRRYAEPYSFLILS